MKSRDDYQREAVQNEFHFPPGSTWIVFTDQVSHAAMGGQHLFEQTFYLPVRAMADENEIPLARAGTRNRPAHWLMAHVTEGEPPTIADSAPGFAVYRSANKRTYPDFFNAPVPSFGDLCSAVR